MKVKVIKSIPTTWYADKIGKEFEVTDNFFMVEGVGYIHKDDVEIIEESENED